MDRTDPEPRSQLTISITLITGAKFAIPPPLNELYSYESGSAVHYILDRSSVGVENEGMNLNTQGRHVFLLKLSR